MKKFFMRVLAVLFFPIILVSSLFLALYEFIRKFFECIADWWNSF